MAARARSRACCRRSAALNHDLSDPSLAPASFGPFRVLHQIGVGVLGPVYRAQDGVRDQLVAVKVFKVDAPPEQAEQIADALQAVVQALPRHNGLIELIAAGVERDTAYLVMTHSDVLSLDTRLKPGVPLDAEEALTIIRTLAEAMDAAHARGIVHGGLHPRDIFVDERGACRAAGFGVATALARAGVRVPVRRPYSPPERLTSAPIEPTADRFALGALAFELLTGRRIVGTGAAAAARASAPVPDADLDKLQTALVAMLAENPAHRPGTATAFAQALQQAIFPRGLARGVGLGAPPVMVRDERHVSAAGMAGAGAAALAGAGAAFLTPPGEADGPSSDDLERFTRQGTLWEANGVTRDEPAPLRWETVEDVTQGVDPLALFAPESPSSGPAATENGARARRSTRDDDEPFAARGEGTAVTKRDGAIGTGDFIGDGTLDTTRRDSILGLSSIPAGSPAFHDDVDDVDDVDGVDDGDDDEELAAEAAADVDDEEAVPEHVPAPREREPGVAPPFLRVDPEERVEQVVEAAREPGFAPPYLHVERDEAIEARDDLAKMDAGADTEAETETATMAVDAGEPLRFFDEPDDDATSELPIVASNVAAAAGVSGRPRIDQDAADRAATVNAWNRDHVDVPYDDVELHDAAAHDRETDPVVPPPVVPPRATRPTPPVAVSGSFINAPEPADVGSPVRVIGIVLALGLAVGGAGGYLLGQRGSLRGPSAIERAETEGAAPSGGADAAASAPAGAASTPSGAANDSAATRGAVDSRAGGTASDRTRAAGTTPGAGAPGSRAGGDASNPNRADAGRAANGATVAPGSSASRATGDRAGAGNSRPNGAPAAGAAAASTASRTGAATGRLTVTSTPSYAEVAVDGVRRGATPLTLRDLPMGSHTVRVTRTGYAPETRRVTLAAGSASSALTFELAPTGRRPPAPASQAGTPPAVTEDTPPVRGSASGLGALYIVSRPMGAQVKVDGRLVGATPLLVTDVSAGSHQVQIDAPGHKPWSTTVQVPAGQRIRVGASLEEGSQE